MFSCLHKIESTFSLFFPSTGSCLYVAMWLKKVNHFLFGSECVMSILCMAFLELIFCDAPLTDNTAAHAVHRKGFSSMLRDRHRMRLVLLNKR